MKIINLNKNDKKAKHHNIDFRYNEVKEKKRYIFMFIKLYRLYLFSYIDRNKCFVNKLKYYAYNIFVWNILLKFFMHSKEFNVFELLKSVSRFKDGYKKKIPYLNLFVTRKCNLSCKGCGALMPLYNATKEKQWYMSVQDIDCILDRYNRLCGGGWRWFDVIDIVGGEPLMHPQLESVFAVIRKYNPNTDVTIVTNGLLLDKLKIDIFELLEKYKIKLSISVYGGDCFFEKINICDDDYIKHEDCSSCSGHVPLYFSGMNSVSVGGVTLAENGDLFYCGFNAVTKFNEYFNTDYKLVYGSDYINIFRVNSFEEILEMMNKPRCCFSRYCKGRKSFRWDVSNCSIDEWQFVYNKLEN